MLRNKLRWRLEGERASIEPFMKIQYLIPILFLAAFCTVSAQTNNTIAEATNSTAIISRNQQLSDEIGRLESLCVPTNGTSRADLEIKYGTGSATFNGMAPPQGGIPADSPYRVYEFCTNGTLFVVYDKTWHVERAEYKDHTRPVILFRSSRLKRRRGHWSRDCNR